MSYTIVDPGNPDFACDAYFQYHIRLGSFGGAKARVGMYAASCIGAGNWNGTFSESWGSWDRSFTQSLTWQHLAFQDSPSLLDKELEEFVDLVKDGVDNSLAWRDALEINQEFSTWNQPVVITRATQGSTYEELIDRSENANFYTMARLPEPKGSTGLIIGDDTTSFSLFDPNPSGCDFY